MEVIVMIVVVQVRQHEIEMAPQYRLHRNIEQFVGRVVQSASAVASR
jgi:hypothetical protein